MPSTTHSLTVVIVAFATLGGCADAPLTHAHPADAHPLASREQAHRDCLVAEASGEPPPGDTDLDGWCDDEDTCPEVVNDQFADIDADGVGDACDPCRGDDATGDADTDRWCADLDCDDNDKNAFPGAPERCDGVLNDCAGALPADELDSDGDRTPDCDDRCVGNDAFGDRDDDGLCGDVDLCLGDNTSGDRDDDGVCDDRDRCIGTDASGDSDVDGVCNDRDLCVGADASGDLDGDGLCADIDLCVGANDRGDTDGDGTCDDRDACVGFDATGDLDGDGFCADRDCDDARTDINPSTPEVCDGRDNDCDSRVDDDPASLCPDGQTCAAAACTALRPCYADRDGDGAGDALDVVLIDPGAACASLDRIDDSSDCDDDPAACGASCAPGRPERCDSVDHDCDGDPRNGGAELCVAPQSGLGVCTLDGCDVLCDAGYVAIDRACVDVDECAAGLPADCADNGACVNNVGGYRCGCAPGYSDTLGDGSRCDAVCGDGIRLPSEACDDANLRSGDGCDAACVAELGWDCAAGGCTPTCGDGLRVGAEPCDDQNLAAGDGCGPDCVVEPGYTCVAEPSVCTLNPYCGDGHVDSGEACDDANRDAGDGCAADCVVEDGFVCVQAGAASLCVFSDGAEGSQPSGPADAASGDGCTAAPGRGPASFALGLAFVAGTRRRRNT